MTAARWIVLVGGVLGTIAFFVPLASFVHRGEARAITAHELFTGVTELEQAQTIAEIRGVIALCFLPGAVLLVLGFVAAIRGRFGRVGGTTAVVLGVIGLLVFYALNAGVDSDPTASRGPAMYLLLAAGALGLAGGVM